MGETMEEWRSNIINSMDGVRAALEESSRIAVLGIKPEDRSTQPAHYVPKYLQEAGYEVIPVPTYYPEVTEILGKEVYRQVNEVPGTVDMVNVFRRSHDIPPHVDDIIAKGPKYVWFQLGIRNDESAERLARAGIRVIQNRCTMADHSRLGIQGR